ncbi:hypothetical protein LTR08_009312 [Meristemomyces frigidus]|nr:hypothetical protein LTR08_009312 [Meristemomyces frigidus]
MKSFTAAMVLGLTAAATAAPSARASKRQAPLCILNSVMNNPQPVDVQASINQWNTDVNMVNAFLNNVANILHDPAELLSQAQTAFIFASDEPCQLMTLASQTDFSTDVGSSTNSFGCAVNDLMAVFQTHVLNNLVTVTSHPTDVPGAIAAVADINNFRCCNVLPDADVLWLASADDNGISNVVQFTAGRPDACATITCDLATQCKALPS